jgi:hypothetical protein
VALSQLHTVDSEGVNTQGDQPKQTDLKAINLGPQRAL